MAMGSVNNWIISLICMFCMSPWPTYETRSSIRETYIVHVEPDDRRTSTTTHSYHNSFLPATNETSIIYSYRTVISGFAVKLSRDELIEMSTKKGFIFAQLETTVSMLTTHSPHFLGLNPNLGMWKNSNYGSGMIIGVVDSGITPHHRSFSPQGMRPPPSKWKGVCEFADHTMCNNKIIGARSFGLENKRKGPFDSDGHGTQVSSIAAGNFVQGASYFGNAYGMASGIAPLAHVAIYQACSVTCDDSDILAAMEAAIDDGVDVLSIPLGTTYVDNFYNNTIAIGAFRAMEKGIIVSCPPGNDGPFYETTYNNAPWILTVSASTMDRQLRATAVLGNNQQFHGQSALQPKYLGYRFLPLVYAPDCNGTNIKGKVVVCEFYHVRGEYGNAVKSAGAAAMILVNEDFYENTTFSDSHALPAVSVGYADGLKIKAYINSTRRPTVKFLFGGTVIGDDHAPMVASFSSRGPSGSSLGILKPDVLGPGVSILAAAAARPNTNFGKLEFEMVSGTSVSCAHLTGVAALLKSAHPDWTPAAIKSAIMTTADVVNHAHNPIEDATFLPADVFATGSGHVNPPAALNPGLVYDIQPTDYIPYMCGLNYTNQQIGMIINRKVDCSKVSAIRDFQLNYPAFMLSFINQTMNSFQTYTRTVTNVGEAPSTYKVNVASPPGFEVVVSPTTLRFSKPNQKMQYQVTFKQLLARDKYKPHVEGHLKWCTDESYYKQQNCVRSPIAIIVDGKTLLY